jgi:hypothetical protein
MRRIDDLVRATSAIISEQVDGAGKPLPGSALDRVMACHPDSHAAVFNLVRATFHVPEHLADEVAMTYLETFTAQATFVDSVLDDIDRL